MLRPYAFIAQTLLLAAWFCSASAMAATYKIDTPGAHAFIQFKISHLGYSWLYGRFNSFEGQFYFDEQRPDASRVEVTIDTASIDSNHAERDKHLKGEDFLDVKKFPKATFTGSKFRRTGKNSGVISGYFTLRGIMKPLDIEVSHIGGGSDPWGGYRQGFEGSTKFSLSDFGINYDLGPHSKEVEIILSVEGIKQ